MTRTSTATRCHYAPDPKSRPGCQLTATVRVGSIPLCSACAELRSTLGKGQPTRRLPTPTDTDAPDALDWVSQAEAELRAAHHTLAASVQRARPHQYPWAAIANRLGTARQAAQQRFGRGTMT